MDYLRSGTNAESGFMLSVEYKASAFPQRCPAKAEHHAYLRIRDTDFRTDTDKPLIYPKLTDSSKERGWW